MTLLHAASAQAEPADDHEDEECPITLPMPGRARVSSGVRVRTGVRAGDTYMMNPPMTNDRNRDRPH